MARVRFLGPEPVTVPELGGRVIQPDEMVEVPDGRFGAYVCQTTNWESVEEPRDWMWPKAEGAESEAELPPEQGGKVSGFAAVCESEPETVLPAKTSRRKTSAAEDSPQKEV